MKHSLEQVVLDVQHFSFGKASAQPVFSQDCYFASLETRRFMIAWICNFWYQEKPNRQNQ